MTITTLYSTGKFEAAFSVSYDVINLLTVGKKASVRLADNPAIILKAHVSELGARADTVSSFPVVVTLDETAPGLRAGMAIEVSFSFPVSTGKGFALPLTVLALEGRIHTPEKYTDPGKATVYIFDPATSTVKRREVLIGGIRENSLIIVSGLKKGERVAVAGVSFLHDGQKVKLLPAKVRE
jgi:multidrug efflux pump subunit AcrA (membrane-fusion protein)